MEPMAYTAVEEPQIVALTDSSLSPFHLVLIYPARQRPGGRSIAVLPRKASAARGGSRSKGVDEHRRLAGESMEMPGREQEVWRRPGARVEAVRRRARGGRREPADRRRAEVPAVRELVAQVPPGVGPAEAAGSRRRDAEACGR